MSKTVIAFTTHNPNVTFPDGREAKRQLRKLPNGAFGVTYRGMVYPVVAKDGQSARIVDDAAKAVEKEKTTTVNLAMLGIEKKSATVPSIPGVDPANPIEEMTKDELVGLLNRLTTLIAQK